MVILSLCGRLRLPNPVIPLPESTLENDFRGLVGLHVQIAHVGRTVGRILAVADAVLRSVPVASLSCWNVMTGQTVLVEEAGIRVMREVPA
jgi:hypothetical protein